MFKRGSLHRQTVGMSSDVVERFVAMGSNHLCYVLPYLFLFEISDPNHVALMFIRCAHADCEAVNQLSGCGTQSHALSGRKEGIYASIRTDVGVDAPHGI
jgi:hypothetical protein